MSDMQEQESIERFIEGMKKAASRARELAAAQKNNDWLNVAKMLDGVRVNGIKLYNGRSMTRQDTLALLDQRQKGLPLN